MTARRRTTITDVARHAGVSKGAVSLGLTGRPVVSDATRVRIAASAEALGRRPSAGAKALSESRALAVGLIVARPARLLASDSCFAGLPEGAVGEGDCTVVGGARATRALPAADPAPTAIVCANDLTAMAGLGGARELGLDVPGDLSVVDFDDDLLAEHVQPPLTTIRRDPVAAGAAAARRLLVRLRGEPLPPLDLPAPVLLTRGSVGPARGG